MITFKEHIELFKNKEKDGGLSNYIESLPPEKKIRIGRGIREIYPLKQTEPKEIYKDFNVCDNVMSLVLGQFIMLEQIITGKTTYESEAENDLAIAELILRPKEDKVFDNSDLKKEIKNKNNILNYPVQEVYSVVVKFLKNREYVLFKQFSGVFYEIPDEDEDEEEEQTITANALFNQQWYWYSMVRMLAKEDITKYDDIYMLKMDTVMPEMSYLAQKNKIEDARRRQSEAERRL